MASLKTASTKSCGWALEPWEVKSQLCRHHHTGGLESKPTNQATNQPSNLSGSAWSGDVSEARGTQVDQWFRLAPSVAVVFRPARLRGSFRSSPLRGHGWSNGIDGYPCGVPIKPPGRTPTDGYFKQTSIKLTIQKAFVSLWFEKASEGLGPFLEQSATLVASSCALTCATNTTQGSGYVIKRDKFIE